MTEVEWTNESVLQLVEDYRRLPELWDRSHELHAVQTAKYEAWTSLAKRFGCDIADLRKKITSVLASYRREKGKVKKGIVSSWFLYPHLKFLSGYINSPAYIPPRTPKPIQRSKPKPILELRIDPLLEPRMETIPEPRLEPILEPRIESRFEPRHEPIIEPIPEPKREPTPESRPEPVQQLFTLEPEDMDRDDDENVDEFIKLAPQSVPPKRPVGFTNLKHTRRLVRSNKESSHSHSHGHSHSHKDSHRHSNTDSKLLEMLRLLKKSDISKKKDECDSFGEYIATSLRKHDDRTQAMIKQAINNILFEQEMKKYTTYSVLISPDENPLENVIVESYEEHNDVMCSD